MTKKHAVSEVGIVLDNCGANKLAMQWPAQAQLALSKKDKKSPPKKKKSISFFEVKKSVQISCCLHLPEGGGCAQRVWEAQAIAIWAW